VRLTVETLKATTAVTRSNVVSVHLIRVADETGVPLADLLACLPPYRSDAWHALYGEAQRSGLAFHGMTAA